MRGCRLLCDLSTMLALNQFIWYSYVWLVTVFFHLYIAFSGGSAGLGLAEREGKGGDVN